MKKLLFLLLLTTFLIASAPSKAQSGHFKKTQSDLCDNTKLKSGHFKKSKEKFGAGIKAGLNYSSQYIKGANNAVDFKYTLGMSAGAYCNYFLLDFLAIQPELMVSTKGSKWKNQFYDAKYNLLYIDLPILIRYQPIDLINIHAGPQFSYLVTAMQKDFGNNTTTNVRGNYYKFDMGMVVGVEANLPMGINLTVRYILGLNPATNGAQYTEVWRNKSFQVSLGYRLLGR